MCRRREGLAAWGGSGDDEREALSKRLVTADKWVSEEPDPRARTGGGEKINFKKKMGGDGDEMESINYTRNGSPATSTQGGEGTQSPQTI